MVNLLIVEGYSRPKRTRLENNPISWKNISPWLNEVIPKVVNSFAKLKSSILCIFSSDVGVFDIDPKCLMTRKGASISYVGPKVLINDFRRVINS